MCNFDVITPPKSRRHKTDDFEGGDDIGALSPLFATRARPSVPFIQACGLEANVGGDLGGGGVDSHVGPAEERGVVIHGEALPNHDLLPETPGRSVVMVPPLGRGVAPAGVEGIPLQVEGGGLVVGSRFGRPRAGGIINHVQKTIDIQNLRFPRGWHWRAGRERPVP